MIKRSYIGRKTANLTVSKQGVSYLFPVCAAFCLAGPSAAQVTTPPDQNEIVVRGVLPENRAQQIREFVGNIIIDDFDDPVTRFETVICPTAVGLSDQENEAIVRRLRFVASKIGMQVASPRCRPNVLVAVVSGKRKFLEALARKQPSLFSQMVPSGFRRLLRDAEPVAAWQRTELISARGTKVTYDAFYDAYVNRTYGTNPRTTQTAHDAFVASAVVIEAESVVGLTVTQLADYAAMRGFAATDPRKVPSSLPSILTAVGVAPGVPVPLSLTKWDFGFLRGLYIGDENRTALERRADLERSIKRELLTDSEGPKR